MSEERLMILKMIAEGRITPEEGDALLDAINAQDDKAKKEDGQRHSNVDLNADQGFNFSYNRQDAEKASEDIYAAQPEPSESQEPIPPIPSVPPAPPIPPIPPVPPASQAPPSAGTSDKASEAPNGFTIPEQSFTIPEIHIPKMDFSALKNVKNDIMNIKNDVMRELKMQKLGKLPNMKKELQRHINHGMQLHYSESQKSEALLREKFEVSHGDIIKLENVDGDISVVGYDGKVATIEAEVEGLTYADDRSPSLRIERNGNEVSIRLVIHPESDPARLPNVEYKLAVPAIAGVAIKSIQGDVRISGIGGEMSASSVSGDVSVQNCSGPISAESTSGDVKFEGPVTSTLTAHTVSGDIQLNASAIAENARLTMNSVSGDVTVVLPGESQLKFNCKTFSGDISINLPVQYEKSGDREVIAVLNEPCSTFDVNTLSGDINIGSL